VRIAFGSEGKSAHLPKRTSISKKSGGFLRSTQSELFRRKPSKTLFQVVRIAFGSAKSASSIERSENEAHRIANLELFAQATKREIR